MIATAEPRSFGNELPESVGTDPLTALVVSADRSLHRLLNRHLQEAEYRSIHTSSVEHALALIESTECHFLLVDADLTSGDSLELCREAGTHPRGEQMAKLLLQSTSAEVELTDLLHAGIDDVLTKPVSYLELLARLRAAARTYEFRRRVAGQLGGDPVTQLPDKHSFLNHLEQLQPQDTQQTCSCLVLAVDHVQQMETADGTKALEKLIVEIAELLGRERLENELLSHWGGGLFFIACAGQGLVESAARAEDLSRSLAAALGGGQQAFPLTVSFGVADSSEGPSAELLVEQALEALQMAHISGGNCVVQRGEHDQEIARLREREAAGNVFQSTFAADLMTPCVLSFTESHGIWHAACLLRRHKIAAAPVIDSTGKCVGIIDLDNLPATPEQAINKNVSVFRSKFAEMCGEETILGDIMHRLTEGDTQWLVITRHGRPTGMISRDQLAEFGQPLTVQSLRKGSHSQPRVSFEELLVPEWNA